MNTSIIVAGKKFNCGTRVVLWNEEEGLSFYPKGKFGKRNLNLKQLREKINSFYIHHSVTYTAHSMFRGLLAQGLSCNFMIDDDINENGCATIYQCLDVKDYGYTQGGKYNHNGAGVEIAYMPDAWSNPNRYSKINQKRFGVQPHKIISDQVRGHKFSKVFAPTDAQVKACLHLALGYKKAFPNLELKFPRDENGNFLSKTVKEEQKFGLLQHFHITTRKIDALGFPHDDFEKKLNDLWADEQKKRISLLSKLFKFINIYKEK